MAFVGKTEVKVFILAVLGVIVAWLMLYPPDQWERIFWDYLNRTAPIFWIGQLGWIIIPALLFTLGYIVVKHL